MNSRTYYGEYSLKHWLQLMLSGNIVLPQYQRSFVWKEQDMKRLIKSLVEKQFVPPVTLALFNSKAQNITTNLIIDGQQRLTTILLLFLGYVPDLDKFETDDVIASGDDSSEDDVDETGTAPKSKIPVKWTIKKLFVDKPSENTVEKIRARLASDDKYYEFNYAGLKDDFFDKTFLGFSYIIPESNNEAEIQNSYTQLFRNINYLGAHLSVVESRRSLYYMKSQYQKYFEGQLEDETDVLCGIALLEKMRLTKIDFVRYLAVLSQYTILDDKDKDKVLKWYSAYSSRESFYSDYVSYIVGVEQESYEKKFDGFDFEATFPDECWKQRFIELHDAISILSPSLGLNKDNAFTSWIDADYWLFGLIYYLVFVGKKLKDDKTLLIDQMTKEIKKKRDTTEYSKSPNRLGNLRERLLKSIEIVGKYVQ